MDIEEIKLKTLANLTTTIEGINIYPLTLREIIQFGYGKYNQLIGLFTIDKHQLIEIDEIPEEITIADIIYHSQNSELVSLFSDALDLFLKDADINYIMNTGLIINNKLIVSSTFNEIVKIIKTQNCLITKEDEKFNPLNERAKRIREKMMENKKKIQELNYEPAEDGLTINDLISIVCANVNGINILNVFDLNIYQFNDQFNRMKMLDEYEINIQALLHGADSNQIELKHWMSKVK